MAFSTADFVQESTTTTGTGTYSLGGANTGYQTFISGNTTGDTVRFSVTDGTDWEVCEGVITSGTPDTLTRGTVLASSNAGSAVSWGAGSKTVSQVFTADEALNIAQTDGTLAQFAATTSAQLAGVISDETGSGSLVFGTSPTITSVTLTIELTAADTVAKGDVCYLNSSGQAKLIDASAASTCDGQLVMAQEAITATNTGTFLVYGVEGGFSSLTPGTVYYASITGTTGNTVSTSQPTASGEIIRKLYTAATSTTIFFNPSVDYGEITGSTGTGNTVLATSPTIASPTITTPAITSPTMTGTILEDVYTVSGTTPALDPDNGSIQIHSLSGTTTYSDSLAEGEAITLMINAGANTVTWPTTTWVNNAGSAPTLATTGYTVVALWKVSTTLYGALVGDGT